MKNILKIIKVAKPLYSLVLIIGILIVLSAILELLSPILSKFIVDDIVSQVQHKGGDTNRLITLIAIVFILRVTSVIFNSFSDRLGDHFSGKLRKLLTEKFYDKVLTLPQTYYDTEVSGKIVNQLSRGIMTIQGFINASTNFIVPMFLQSIITIGILAYYNIPTAIFTFLLFPTYLLISYFSAKKWGEEEVKKNKYEDISRGRIQEVISNIKVVKSFSNEQKEYDIISNNLSTINKIYAKQSNMFHIFDFLRNFSLIVVLLIVNLVVFYGAFKGQISIGTMILILQLIDQARRPLFAMSFILTQIQNAESGSKEFFEILSLPSTENYKSKESTKFINNPTIEFKNVNFKYETGDYVLKNISFKIDSKEIVALVGPSGTGKTTIVNLIMKFYEKFEGDIFLKDQNYKNISHFFVRNNISLVFQENELFSTTIRENVAYGSYANEDEIINALKLANAYNFVKKLPKGLDSEIGERGVRLSGGQKQRIQIARAILKNSPILILDEATSSLDAKSEKEVQEGLENLMKDKLVIVIAHRFSTIQNVHKVIVLNKGEIVDYGNPKELSQKPGIYSDLLKYQIEGNKKLLEQYEIY